MMLIESLQAFVVGTLSTHKMHDLDYISIFAPLTSNNQQ
jgi:hypothetical protein